MNRIAVYTAIFGDRDTYKIPPQLGKNYAFFLFTDNPPKDAPPWVTVIPMKPPIPGDPIRSSKCVKLRPEVWLPGENITLWIDGSMLIKHFDGLEKSIDKYDAALFPHPVRRCIYEEGKVCISRKKDTAQLISSQMQRYRTERYPERNGLVASAGVLRRNTKAVAEFNKVWWDQVKYGSRRDQLSCNYALWKTKTPQAALDDGLAGDVRHNKWWDICPDKDRIPLPPPVPPQKTTSITENIGFGSMKKP